MIERGINQADSNHSSLEIIVKSNTTFALSLYQNLNNKQGNLFFSPYSISTALAMTFAGSRGNTEKQMAETLCFRHDQKIIHAAFSELETQLGAIQRRGNVQLYVANSLWPQEGHPFLFAYTDLLEKYYGATFTSVDYGQPEIARGTINRWVEAKTAEKIKELIGSMVLDPSTKLVLANAIYFKGDWIKQFDEAKTQNALFWVSPTESVGVPMMAQESEFGYLETASLQILELPYKGDEISFIILLPKTIDGLVELENSLSEETLKPLTGKLPKRKVSVTLPKFKMESRFELSQILISMGMEDAFGNADFSGMDGGVGQLYISFVIHQAVMEVNEEGSEAAAATAVVMSKSLPSFEEFRADHPFLFLIKENQTGSILFFGRMLHPDPDAQQDS